MKLRHPFHRKRVEISQRVKAMVDGVDKNIIDIKQNSAIRLLRHRLRPPHLLLSLKPRLLPHQLRQCLQEVRLSFRRARVCSSA